MSFIVTKQARADANVELVKNILLRLKNAGIEWTPAALSDAAALLGVSYTAEEFEAVLKGLYVAGIIEDVIEVVISPVPVPITPITE